ncbi:MAG TPA: hypothetical protein VFC23_01660 [Thermoanaerobaculia bacterium]|nr:hypothetical protein [Thermoanaerobaculia bacterium]
MQIADFHLKFTSNEHDNLFQALRKLSLVEDMKSLFAGHGDHVFFFEWSPWPPVQAPCRA